MNIQIPVIDKVITATPQNQYLDLFPIYYFPIEIINPYWIEEYYEIFIQYNDIRIAINYLYETIDDIYQKGFNNYIDIIKNASQYTIFHEFIRKTQDIHFITNHLKPNKDIHSINIIYKNKYIGSQEYIVKINERELMQELSQLIPTYDKNTYESFIISAIPIRSLLSIFNKEVENDNFFKVLFIYIKTITPNETNHALIQKARLYYFEWRRNFGNTNPLNISIMFSNKTSAFLCPIFDRNELKVNENILKKEFLFYHQDELQFASIMFEHFIKDFNNYEFLRILTSVDLPKYLNTFMKVCHHNQIALLYYEIILDNDLPESALYLMIRMMCSASSDYKVHLSFLKGIRDIELYNLYLFNLTHWQPNLKTEFSNPQINSINLNEYYQNHFIINPISEQDIIKKQRFKDLKSHNIITHNQNEYLFNLVFGSILTMTGDFDKYDPHSDKLLYFFILLSQHFTNICIIHKNTPYLYAPEFGAILNYNIEESNLEGFDNMIEKIQNHCNSDTQFIVIPVYVHFKDGSHANALIINKETQEVEHFEPSNENVPHLYNQLQSNFEKLGYKYFEPNTFCFPFQFHQAMQHRKHGYENAPGYCLVWTIYYIFIRILLPHLSRNQVIEEMKQIIQKINSNKQYITFIRNFAQYLSNLKFTQETYFPSFKIY